MVSINGMYVGQCLVRYNEQEFDRHGIVVRNNCGACNYSSGMGGDEIMEKTVEIAICLLVVLLLFVFTGLAYKLLVWVWGW